MSVDMNEFLTSSHFIALAFGSVIFLITVFLAAKKYIDFPLTVLFLIFAIAASIAIENYDLFRMMEHHRSPQSQLEALELIVNDNQEMKDQMEKQSKKLQHLIDATEHYIKSAGEHPPEASPAIHP